jgi:hypothetical protein
MLMYNQKSVHLLSSGQHVESRGRHGIDVVGNHDGMFPSGKSQDVPIGRLFPSEVSQPRELNGRLIPNCAADNNIM